ncbi:hypothetical protein BDW22DRAFT_858715 [Trametopsis cervina]|nr:hypothetical protein BDW22DRAFT_858715 [Trametopsis cervina]
MSGLPPDVPVPESTLLLIGPVFAGALASFLLFGISIMQVYHYSMHYPRDTLVIKVTVWSVFLLDIFQTLTMASLGWYALCSGWGRPLALLRLNWTFSAVPAVTGIVAAWVQTFYAWRIYKIGQWMIVPGLIVAIALMQCAAALAIAIGIPSLQDVTFLHTLYRRTIVWLGGAAADDVAIAFSMLYLLFTVRRTKFQRTQRVVNRLIRLTVETGVVTATCALLELIMFQVFQTNNLHIFFAAVLAKVYSNALMTSLNSRHAHNRPGDAEGGGAGGAVSNQYTSFSQSGSGGGIPGTNSAYGYGRRSAATMGGAAPTVVHISTRTEMDGDGGSEVGYDVKGETVLGGIHTPEALEMSKLPVPNVHTGAAF